MPKDVINYSQCWEDPDVLLSALSIQPEDSVLSITSGGDNTLALLAKQPQRIVSIDLNPAQNYLLELKHAAARLLSYAEYRAFIATAASDVCRVAYERVRTGLSAGADAWWAGHIPMLERGVIHAGRFERFTGFFARRILPYIHSRKTIEALLSLEETQAQEQFYHARWNTPLWRLSFRLAASRLLLSRVRHQAMFAHTQIRSTAAAYAGRLERHLTTRPVKGNFFLEYSLTGDYGDTMPPYLRQEGYEAIRQNQRTKLDIVCSDVLSYLQAMPDASFSKFNLSDVFEALSAEEYEALWKQIVRTGKQNARIVYWTNLVSRPLPESVAPFVQEEANLAGALGASDRVFFYGSFHIHTISK